MAADDQFKQMVIATIARRAANRCSNPDCRAITSGPTEKPMGAVNIGEAAHIFGANPGSARYDADMSSAERSAISNAIWLCGNCHKLVDDDEMHYPAGILFEWQRNHERWVADRIGKAGAELRQRYEDRRLEEFGKLSYLAERIILEKGDFWEYRLASEVLRFEISPILRRWDGLNRGIYISPLSRIEKENFGAFVRIKFEELRSISSAFCSLVNLEFERAWGKPGVKGDDMEIVETCRSLAELCRSCLVWEESVKFVYVPDIFEEVRGLLCGRAGDILEEIRKIPKFLAEILSKDNISGNHLLSLEPQFRENWEEDFQAALARVKAKWEEDL